MVKFFILILFVIFFIIKLWSNTVFHINENLINWYDELFVIWILQNNIQHFSSLDIANIFETNALYTFKYTLSFAEQLFTQSLLAFVLNIFNQNPLFHYNFLIVSNHILIFLSSLLFFNKLLKNKFAALLSSIYSTFSPYFFTEVSHFQMIYYWPLFISLYFLINFIESHKKKMLFASGIFLGIQFLSSVYLGIMSLLIAGVFLFIHSISQKIKPQNVLKNFLLLLLAFFLISGFSFYGYYLVHKEYGAVRDYSEFIIYSAHLTDYLFPNTRQDSFLYSSPIFSKIKSYNHHPGSAAFIGLAPILMIFLLLFPKIKRVQQNINIIWNINPMIILSGILLITGFVFSLGPRLSVNGHYAEIPLPYHILLKIFSPLEIIRCVVRWQFLIMIGASIMIGLSYIEIEKKIRVKFPILKFFLIDILVVLFILEFSPLTSFPSSSKQWNGPSYQFLSNSICKNPGKSILEYPFNYRNLDGNLAKGVNYMASILMDSTQHKCKTLSGYYGYEPPLYIKIKTEFADGFNEKDIRLAKELKIDYIKFNKYAVSDQELATLRLKNYFNQSDIIYEDDHSIILDTKRMPIF